MREKVLPEQRVIAIAEELAGFLLKEMVDDAGEFSVNCWEYALEAIIKWFISIFMFMIIVYSPCYNCINQKHNTYVEYKQPEIGRASCRERV